MQFFLRVTVVLCGAGWTLHQGATVAAQSSYVPLRQAVAHGTYHPPNYLGVVDTTVRGDEAYRLFSTVAGDHYPHAVGRFGKDEVLVHMLRQNRSQRGQHLGLYAEDRFIEAHRQSGWRKVSDRFAPQRDIWRRVDGRIEYGQIKVHGLGHSAPTLRDLAAVYLESMRKDSGRGQARWFLVPDDHVDAIKRLIDERREAAVRRHDIGEAIWLLRQKERVTQLGVSYETLSREADLAQQAGRGRMVARSVGPLLAVTFLAGSAGNDVYRWSSGEISGGELIVRLGRTGSVVSVGFATSFLVSRSEFLKANPYRAGGAVTAAILVAEEGWLIYQHGGFRKALDSPEFYVKSGGNVGAAALGLIGAIEVGKVGAAIGMPFGPAGMAFGGTFGAVVGGAVGGLAGYLVGAALTEWMLEAFAPAIYFRMKLKEIDRAESRFQKEADRLSDLSRPLRGIASTP